jgi:dihydropyrimidinase
VIDATGMLLLPGGIDVHTHLDMPFGGTTSSDDFETGTRAAAFGGTTTLSISPSRRAARRCATRSTPGGKRPKTKASIDYGLHMIVTDLYEAGLEDMDAMVREGVASFKLFMAYPGRADGGRRHHFQSALADRQERRAHLHACRKRRRDRRDRARALAEGKTAPIYHALTRRPPPKPKPCIAPSPWRRWPARRFTSCTFRRKTR